VIGDGRRARRTVVARPNGEEHGDDHGCRQVCLVTTGKPAAGDFFSIL